MTDNYSLYPLTGHFDVAAIEAQAAALDHMFRDPVRCDILRFIVCASKDAVEHVQEKRVKNPTRIGPDGILDIWPDRVEVAQECAALTMRHVRDFVSWLTSTYTCKIIDEEGRVHTELSTLFPPDLDA